MIMQYISSVMLLKSCVRLHVIANSNSPEDQLNYVRNAVLKHLEEKLKMPKPPVKPNK